MQTVALADKIELSIQGDDIDLMTNLSNLPVGEDNLIVKAIRLFQEKTRIVFGARIRLEKNIPVSGGMGGGSSNAATILLALNNLFDKPFSLVELSNLCKKLGSDVPFFLHGGTAIARGRGELIEPIEFIGSIPTVLINPGFPVLTALIYNKFRLLLTKDSVAPNMATAFSKISLADLSRFAMLQNDLEETVFQEYPIIRKVKKLLIDNGAISAMVSGSGGTVFGLFASQEEAKRAKSVAEICYPWVALTETNRGDVEL